MTPLPKKKHAKSRTRTRKSTKKITLPKLVNCPKCASLKLPHHVCPKCGYYKDLKVLAPAKAGLRDLKVLAPAKAGLKQDTK